MALTVAEEVTAAQVRQALVRGGGGVLESVRQFDEYRGSQLPPGTKSLAFALRFRALTGRSRMLTWLRPATQRWRRRWPTSGRCCARADRRTTHSAGGDSRA